MSQTKLIHAELTHEVLAAAFEVHRVLGPGLLESAYKACLARELTVRRLAFASEAPVGISYKGTDVETGYRADLIIEGKVLVELKAIDHLLSIHDAQLMTYLRLSGMRVGLLINFNVSSLRNGIRRLVQ